MTRISTKDAIAMGLIPDAGKHNKFQVAPKAYRTHNGKVYPSKAEMLYAMQLEIDSDVLGFAEQPRVQLGPDTAYRPDFVVIAKKNTYFVDVKGAETPGFKKVKKLWAKYMRVPLHVVRRKRSGFETAEVIEQNKI